MRRGTRNYDHTNLNRVRRFRRESSVSEDVLWKFIRDQKLGFKFKRQYPAGPFVFDFFCAEAQLAVEVDGEQHELRKDQDLARDEWALSKGIETLRIPSLDLFEYTGQVGFAWLIKIQRSCEERSGRPAFPDQQLEIEPQLDEI